MRDAADDGVLITQGTTGAASARLMPHVKPEADSVG
jgi:hypothetical protein